MKKIVKIIGIIWMLILLITTSVFLVIYNFGFSGLSDYNKPKDGQIRVACVGDSITYGHGVFNWKRNHYPSKLQRLLGKEYCVSNFGVSSYCAQYDSSRPYANIQAYQDSIDFDADILVFMLGTNDSKPYNWNGVEDFAKDYDKLLSSYLENNNDLEVYLCTPATAFDDDPSTLESTFDIQPFAVEEIAQFVRDYALEKGYNLIDINNLTENRRDLFLSDLIHPNAKGANAIAEEVYKNIKK